MTENKVLICYRTIGNYLAEAMFLTPDNINDVKTWSGWDEAEMQAGFNRYIVKPDSDPGLGALYKNLLSYTPEAFETSFKVIDEKSLTAFHERELTTNNAQHHLKKAVLKIGVDYNLTHHELASLLAEEIASYSKMGLQHERRVKED